MGRQIGARRKEGDTKITNYFLPAESGEKRKFREFTSWEEGMEIENGKRMRMNQEKRKNEKKRMETEKISEKDEEFSTLQTQTDQGEKSKIGILYVGQNLSIIKCIFQGGKSSTGCPTKNGTQGKHTLWQY